MYAEERQQHIVDRARREGRVDVAELSAELAVTGETIRRDLSVLERHGLLRRVHGGAIPVERLGFEPALAARDTLLTAEKDRIAKAALAEVPDEGSIILDAGSTTARLAEILPVDRQLTVLTNAPADRALARHPGQHHRAVRRRPGPRPHARLRRPVGHGVARAELRGRRVRGHQRRVRAARADHAGPGGGRGEEGHDRRRPADRAARRPHQGHAPTTSPASAGSPTSTRSSPTPASTSEPPPRSSPAAPGWYEHDNPPPGIQTSGRVGAARSLKARTCGWVASRSPWVRLAAAGLEQTP